MSALIPHAPQGNVPAIGIPDSQDIPRLVFSAPYFEQVPLAELIEPSVIEAVEAALPALVPPYVDAAAQAAVQQLAVLLTGSTMTGPLFLSPLMPTQPSQAATMAYVDSMVATAGIPEVPPVPSGQVWARETGQWVPITPQTGVFLPLSGGSMTGNINMSGNTIQNMAAVPAMPNGAAPAQWVLNQIASVSLYQGTWNADANVPDLTQLSTHVNAYTWIAVTTSPSGVVIGPAIPGLQGMTIFNGDTIIYSTVQGQFVSIHAGGLTLPEADARYVQLGGSQMSGPLLLNANASQPLQAVTYQQLQTFVPPGAVPEAPNDGQLYGRNGLTASWAPVLPLAGGILTGALTLAGNATANLNPVPLQQMTSAISAATAGLLPLSGGTMTGLMTLSGNASVALNPVPLQQLNSMLATYATTNFVNSTFLPLVGGTLTGPLNGTAATLSGALAAAAATLSGALTATAANITTTGATTASININGGGAGGAEASLRLTGNAPVIFWNYPQFSQEWSMFPDGNAGGNLTILNETHGQGALAIRSSDSVVFFLNSILPSVNNGNTFVGFTGNAFTAMYAYAFENLSDPREKHDITDAAPGALAAVNAVAVKNFHWLQEDKTKPLHIGWLATDVQAALPELATVHVGEDEAHTLALNAMEMTAILWQAVQELSAEVTALKA